VIVCEGLIKEVDADIVILKALKYTNGVIAGIYGIVFETEADGIFL
jgi:hypothetical protein